MPLVLKKKPAPAPVSNKAASKKKPALSVVSNIRVSALAEIIDRVGSLQDDALIIKARIKADEEKLKPYADALKNLQAAIDKFIVPDDDTITELGEKYKLVAGAKAKSRKIKNLALVRKFLGEETFMELASVKLGDLDKYLAPPQLDKCLETSRGSRALKLSARA
jgi:hypothetical protein